MKKELDDLLCKEYPKMFSERNLPMTETCMCWGFAHGNGWFNILEALCGNAQHHIDQSRKQRARALRFNRALQRALEGDKEPVCKFYSISDAGHYSEWTLRQVEEDIAFARFRPVEEACPQVVVSQVKEKFGTLRFYYSGGDDYISGLVSMAESMSACTCEECGSPGTQTNDGWIRTICKQCERKLSERRKAEEQVVAQLISTIK